MPPILLALSALASASGGQPPQTYALPPSSLAEINRRLEPPRRTGVIGAERPRCPEAQEENEIVVCGSDDSERYRVGPLPPGPGDAPTFTGRRSYGSAFEEIACTHNCPPKAMIDVIGAANKIRGAIGRLLDGD